MTAVMPARTLPSHRLDLIAHQRVHGPMPAFVGRREVIDAVAAADIRGRGGGGFPTARKLAAVRGRRTIVVANGCESDPLSTKDRALLALAPHLVLDGIQVAAYAIGAKEAVLCLHRGSPVLEGVARALVERDTDMVRIVEIPPYYVASEESALVHYLTSGDARPTGKEPRPAERGMLVQNVDTLAQLALVARLGPENYRRSRTDLVTVGGAVVEVAAGTTIGSLVGPSEAVLVGGYGGRWVPWSVAVDMPCATGLSSVYALPSSSCGLMFTAKILARLAAESARQCGPCMFGLPAIAQDFDELVHGVAAAADRLARRLPLIAGRGACAHPDGAVRLATSALAVFQYDVSAHIRTRSCGVVS
jgi:NADH:ubiquinone oxidoreductase subunit F (NADH-binding)